MILGNSPIKYAFNKYFTWEGRIISRIIIVFLTYRKWMWNIISSLVTTSIIYFIMKIINPKNKKATLLLIFLTFLLMSFKVFTQTLIWVTGNITYVFILPLLLMYFYFVFNTEKYNKNKIILLSMLNIVMTMFIEQMSILLVISNVIFFLYKSIKNKKIDKSSLVFLICSLFGTTLMLLSPGSQLRYNEYHSYFKSLSIFNKILYNIPNFIKYTYTINFFLLILLSTTNLILVKKINAKKSIKIILWLFTLIIPIGTCISYLLSTINIDIPFFIDNTNKLLCLYYFVYTIITFYLIYKEKNKKAIFFFAIGILSNLIMLLSPTSGNRSTIGTYIFTTISLLIIIDSNIKFNKRTICVLTTFVIIFCSVHLTFYISAYRLHNEHLNNIKQARENKKDKLYLRKYPETLDFLLPVGDSYKEGLFKKIYGINDNVNIIYKDNNWKYKIFYSEYIN